MAQLSESTRSPSSMVGTILRSPSQMVPISVKATPRLSCSRPLCASAMVVRQAWGLK